MVKIVKLCLRCGSSEIITPPPGYFVPGRAETAGVYYCRKCGYVGAPLLVDEKDVDKCKFGKRVSCGGLVR